MVHTFCSRIKGQEINICFKELLKEKDKFKLKINMTEWQKKTQDDKPTNGGVKIMLALKHTPQTVCNLFAKANFPKSAITIVANENENNSQTDFEHLRPFRDAAADFASIDNVMYSEEPSTDIGEVVISATA
uniref:Uncharacterized protein n=1 Tax=Timema poppense TaxID=170557 RepID=A0A7R9GY80_TIMPO|nr:unnamed protein product [Timema poppensis]